ncbi:hypothetical protein BDZ97DRAFT_1919514 [Flammula alnicola]|nr:hypothetical protein BDZ97DRAFT_1919514 [Flammula alnicola]
MPITTRNIAKGVPPRLHLPKGPTTKHKPSTGNKGGTTKPTQTRKSHKRNTTESDDGSEESSQSEDSEPRARKKKRAKWHVTESEEEVEDIEADAAPVEDVDATSSQQPGSADEDEEDGLNDHQCGDDLQEKPGKKDSTLDLLTVMTDKVKVRFKVGADKYEMETGR